MSSGERSTPARCNDLRRTIFKRVDNIIYRAEKITEGTLCRFAIEPFDIGESYLKGHLELVLKFSTGLVLHEQQLACSAVPAEVQGESAHLLMQGKRRDGRGGENLKRDLVFVRPRCSTQGAEQIVSPAAGVPTWIRLEPVDHGAEFVGYYFVFPLLKPMVKVNQVGGEGEVDIAFRESALDDRYCSEHRLVQSVLQPNNNTRRELSQDAWKRGGIEPDLMLIAARLRIHLDKLSVGLIVEEGSGFCSELVEVFARPSQLMLSAFEGV